MAKSPNAFRTISEASAEVGAPQHVLRFWETKFTFVQPVKRAGGRRFYRPQDILALQAVRKLLHDDGLTIKGVQKLYRTGGLKRLLADDLPIHDIQDESVPSALLDSPPATAAATPNPSGLAAVLARLESARARLDAVLSR